MKKHRIQWTKYSYIFSIIKQCPLFLMLVISSLFLTFFAYFGKSTIYNDYSVELTKTPSLAIVMEGIKDDVDLLELFYQKAFESTSLSDSELIEDEKKPPLKENPNEIDPNQPTITYEYVPVGTNYFDDALFIGDSRIKGLSLYSSWDNATFYSETGLTVYSLFEKEFVPIEGEHNKFMKLETALLEKQFKKIYLMIGINELGRGTDEAFLEQYKKAVDRIHELQPEAIIFVQAILHVSKEKNDQKTYINNEVIHSRNQLLKTLANHSYIFYLDSNDVLCTEEGYLISDYTFDGVHLKASQYDPWKSSILQQGIITQDSADTSIPVNWGVIDYHMKPYLFDQFSPTETSNNDMDQVVRRLWWLANTVYNTDSTCFSVPPTTDTPPEDFSSLGPIMQFIDYDTMVKGIFSENAQEQLELSTFGKIPYLLFEDDTVYHLGTWNIPTNFENSMVSYVLESGTETLQNYIITYQVFDFFDPDKEPTYYEIPFDIIKIGDQWFVDSYRFPTASYPGF